MSKVSCIIENAIQELDKLSFKDNLSLNGKPTVYLNDAIKILLVVKNQLKETFEDA